MGEPATEVNHAGVAASTKPSPANPMKHHLKRLVMPLKFPPHRNQNLNLSTVGVALPHTVVVTPQPVRELGVVAANKVGPMQIDKLVSKIAMYLNQ